MTETLVWLVFGAPAILLVVGGLLHEFRTRRKA